MSEKTVDLRFGVTGEGPFKRAFLLIDAGHDDAGASAPVLPGSHVFPGDGIPEGARFIAAYASGNPNVEEVTSGLHSAEVKHKVGTDWPAGSREAVAELFTQVGVSANILDWVA